MDLISFFIHQKSSLWHDRAFCPQWWLWTNWQSCGI